ncbi:MAG: M48 family metallopeptidase [Chloroflexi bacterium]|nr:M48 family metallopeptidase [Chloroflexota bacterium]
MIPIDQLIRTKRKSIALIVQRDGSLIVRAPLRASEKQIQAFVTKKASWILSKQKLVKAVYPPFVPREYVNGEGFWYLGKIHKLEIVETQRPAVYLNGNFRLAQKALSRAEGAFIKWYKSQALQVITERVQWYAAKHGLQYKQIKITSAQTRWGSYNSRGTLSFSWRLVMAPVPVIDYVVAHELVHGQENNHSKKFWTKLQLIMPDYKQRIEWLEQNGHLLSLG